MIRVLKNADFSGCGLGTIELPIPASSEADDVVSKFSNISPEKEIKLRKFIDTLVYHGIYEKLLYLAIPEVANDTTEAIQNVLIDRATTLLTTNTTLTNGKGLKIGDGTEVSYLNDSESYIPNGTGIKNADLVSNRVQGKYSFGVLIEYPEYANYYASAIMASKNISGNPNYNKIVLKDYGADASSPGLNAYLSSNDWITYAQGSLNGDNKKAIQIVSADMTIPNTPELYQSVSAKCIALSSAGVSSKEDEEFNTLPCDMQPPRMLFGDLHSSIRFNGFFKVMFEGKFLNESEVIVMRDAIVRLCEAN